MTVVKLSDYAKEAKGNVPLSITFFGAQFHDKKGRIASLNITVDAADGDVMGVLQTVKDEGGLGQFRSGQYLFLPWPCACVVMHTPDAVPFEIGENFEPELQGS